MESVHASLYHVKSSQKLDDNNLSKIDYKDWKTIADFVNERRVLYTYIQLEFIQKSEICLTFVFRHRKRAQGVISIDFPEIIPDSQRLK